MLEKLSKSNKSNRAIIIIPRLHLMKHLHSKEAFAENGLFATEEHVPVSAAEAPISKLASCGVVS